MPRIFTFRLDRPGLARARILIERETLPDNGDLESAFLDGVRDLERHPPDSRVAPVLRSLAADGCDTVVVIRNPDLVLDADLPVRLAAAIGALPARGCWSIAGAGGLGLHDSRHLAAYATQTPSIPAPPVAKPLVDVMPDLYIVDADFFASVFDDQQALPDAALETILAVDGYLAGRVALFLPQLSAGIVGHFRARDISRLTEELEDRYAGRLAGQSIGTLSGTIAMARPAERAPAPVESLDRAVATVVAGMAPAFSISVVVRTQFTRPYLLERLLGSLCRARIPQIDLDVVLSSDADADLALSETDRLAAHYRDLGIRLQHNPAARHSRVGNLVGGARAALGDYVVFIDDDDYVDLFALHNIRGAGFGGHWPLIVTSTELHAEEWQPTSGGRWILAESRPHARHPSRGWRDMFSGVNRLPVCALLLPRERLIARLDRHDLDHDLSEDYALFLLVLTDPELPEILEIPETFCHVSIRGEQNTVTMPDRRPWARDIAAHLSGLTANRGVAGPGLWQLLAQQRREETVDQSTIDELRRTVELLRANLALARRDVQRLRADTIRSLEAAA